MMLDLLRDALTRENMLPVQGDALVLCALSGGADSVALAHALHAMGPKCGLCVQAAHLNHGLRGAESERDEAYVRTFCAEHGIPLHVERADVRAQAQAQRRGIEETARDVRYAFLAKTAHDIGAYAVATAHNADDNLETMLLNLCRGTGPHGLAGILPVRMHGEGAGAVRIIRPLLFCTRAQIEEYLAQCGIDYMIDSSNLSRDYARNRLRLDVLPVLRSVNARVAEHAAHASGLLRADAVYLTRQAQTLFSAYAVHRGAEICFDAVRLIQQEPVLRMRLLRLLYTEAARLSGLPALPPDAQTAVRIESLLAHKHPSAALSLPDGLCARREYALLVLGPPPAVRRLCERTLSVPGELRCPEAGLVISTELVKKSSNSPDGFHTLSVDSSKIHGILSVRARKQGDLLHLPGRPARSLKKLFMEAGIPRYLRESIPVVCDGENIVAVQGFGVDRRYADADGVRLFIHFCPLEARENPETEK